MAIVQPKSLVYRQAAAHVFLLAFLCIIMFPLLMIVAISFRQGNFSVGDVIPKFSTSTLDHWRLALGFDVRKLTKVSGAVVNIANVDGKTQFYVTSKEDAGFANFVTDPFSVKDASQATTDEPLIVEANPGEADESVVFEDASKSLEACKDVA